MFLVRTRIEFLTTVDLLPLAIGKTLQVLFWVMECLTELIKSVHANAILHTGVAGRGFVAMFLAVT